MPTIIICVSAFFTCTFTIDKHNNYISMCTDAGSLQVYREYYEPKIWKGMIKKMDEDPNVKCYSDNQEVL